MPRALLRSTTDAPETCWRSSPNRNMSEGFWVVSRWGPKLHMVGCTCGVCCSRRKHQQANDVNKRTTRQDKDSRLDSVLTPRQTNVADQQPSLPDAVVATPPPTQLPQSASWPEQQGHPHAESQCTETLAHKSAPELTEKAAPPAITPAASTQAKSAGKAATKVIPAGCLLPMFILICIQLLHACNPY